MHIRPKVDGATDGLSCSEIHAALRKSGFTLIEVLVVVVIMAILAGMVLGLASHATKRGDESKARADLAKITAAVEAYRVETGRYPTNTIAENSVYLTDQLWNQPYKQQKRPYLVMKGWINSNTAYVLENPWGNQYRYFHNAVTGALHHPGRFGYDLWSIGPGGITNFNNWTAQ